MPTAVYVVAAVAGVAAVLAFKEFVYDPHLAPKVDRFVEELLHTHRESRRRAQGRRVAAAVPVLVPESDSDYGAPPRRARQPTRHDVDALVEQEMQVWRDSEHDGLRRRRTGYATDEPQAARTVRRAPPPPPPPAGYDASPLPPAAAALIAAASSPRPPSARSSVSTTPHQGRSPEVRSSQVRSPEVMSPRSDHSSTLFSVSSRSSTPDMLSPRVRSPQPQSPPAPPPRPRAQSPPYAVRDGTRSPPARVLSPFSDIEMPTSPFAGVASPRAGSPFSDFMAVTGDLGAHSPRAVASGTATVHASPRAAAADTGLRSGTTTEDEMFSVSSGSPPPSEFGVDDVDLLSDIGSVHGSDLSGWESVSGRQR